MRKISEVFETNDYNMFKFISNNRSVSSSHINKIIKSMQKKRLISPILVNENREIIDGQHRFLAQKQLKMPIAYIEQEGYGEEETQILNTNTKNWSFLDWEKYYCNKNNENYKIYRDFRKKYSFGMEQNIQLLQGKVSHYKEAFKEGFFKVISYNKAIKRAEMIMEISKYYKDYNNRFFLRAIIHCFDNKDYNNNVFIKKISYQGNSLVRCVDKKSYLRLIEHIYNYKIRENTKALRLF